MKPERFPQHPDIEDVASENSSQFNTQLKEQLEAALRDGENGDYWKDVHDTEAKEDGERVVINTDRLTAERSPKTEYEAMQAAAAAWDESPGDDDVVDMDALAAAPSKRLKVVSAEAAVPTEDDVSPLLSDLQPLEEEPTDVVSDRILNRLHDLRENTKRVESDTKPIAIEAGALGIASPELSTEGLDTLRETVLLQYQTVRQQYRGIPGVISIELDHAHDAIERQIVAIETSLEGSWSSMTMKADITALNEAVQNFIAAKETIERYQASVTEDPSLKETPAEKEVAEDYKNEQEAVAEAYRLRDAKLNQLSNLEANLEGMASAVSEGRRATEDRKRFGVLAQKLRTLVERPFTEGADQDVEEISYTEAEKTQINTLVEELRALKQTIERREGVQQQDVLILENPLPRDEVEATVTSFELASPEELKHEYLPQLEALTASLEATRGKVPSEVHAAKERVDFKDGVRRVEALLSELTEETISPEHVDVIKKRIAEVQALHASILRKESKRGVVLKSEEKPVGGTVAAYPRSAMDYRDDLVELERLLAKSAKEEQNTTLAEKERTQFADASQKLKETLLDIPNPESMTPEERVTVEQLYRDAHLQFKEVAKHEKGSSLNADVLKGEDEAVLDGQVGAATAMEETPTFGESELDATPVPAAYVTKPERVDAIAGVHEDVPGMATMPELSERADQVFNEMLARFPGGGASSKAWRGGWLRRGVHDMEVRDFMSTKHEADPARIWLGVLVDEAYPRVPKIEDNTTLEQFVRKLSMNVALANQEQEASIQGAAVATERDL